MLDRPGFKPHLHVEIVAGEGLVLFSDDPPIILADPLYALVAAQIDGRSTPAAIVERLTGRADAADVHRVLDALERRGVLGDGTFTLQADEASAWSMRDVDPRLAQERLASTSVSITALGGLSPDHLEGALAAAHVRVDPTSPRRIVLTDDYLRPELGVINQDALDTPEDWLIVKPVGAVIWLGPLVRPGRTACWECLAQRLRINRAAEQFISAHFGRDVPAPVAATDATRLIAANAAASIVASWIARDESPTVESAIVTVDLRTWTSTRHHIVWRPQCPACGDPIDGVDAVPPPIVLESRQKLFVLDGGHRTTAPETTLDRFEHHVSPISGAVNMLVRAGLSKDGVLHSYAAGSNFARRPRTLDMLSEGLRSRAGGKGITDAQARASALCESLERYSGVFHGGEPRREARFVDLGGQAIHPNACMGFSDRQYDGRDAWNATAGSSQRVPAPFDERARVSWTPAWSLTRDEARFLPTAFCFYAYPLESETAYCVADSNGNAAGNTIEEAILQGFLELVERDSVALWWYPRARRPAVVLESFDEPFAASITAHLAARGRDLALLDVTSDLGVPAFAAVSRRLDPPEEILLGFGAHLDARIAVQRAVTELIQMLLRVQSNDLRRDASPAVGDNHVRDWLARATIADHPYLSADPAQPARTAAAYSRLWSDDLRDDVRWCQALVERHGMEMLVLDQTRPDIGLPVVKVIVPGLRHFWRRLGPGRLYDAPMRLGWIPAAIPEEQLNPIPMFL